MITTMRTCFTIALLAGGLSLSAQVQVDKIIELQGADGERKITNLELPTAGTDAANKDYVDAAVAAGGSGGSTATMISNESVSTYRYYTGLIYCRDLVESGYSDWRFPTVDDFEKLVTDNYSFPNPTSFNYFFLRVPGGGASDGIAIIRLSDGAAASGTFTLNGYYMRCVR